MALYLIFMILVSFENVKKYSHVVARLPQRLKSTLFEMFSTLWIPFGHPPFEKISNNDDFSLWGKQCICPAKMRPKLWKSHIVLRCGPTLLLTWRPNHLRKWFHSKLTLDQQASYPSLTPACHRMMRKLKNGNFANLPFGVTLSH